jgi:hypothetical protein
MLSFPGSATQPWHSDGPHIRGCGEAAHRVGYGMAGAPEPDAKFNPNGFHAGKEAAAANAAAPGRKDKGSVVPGTPADDEEAEAEGAPGVQPFYAPVHALNVFVPLVDLSEDRGPTEFVPGSHRDYDVDAPSKKETLLKGQALLFDYRLKHRGLGNNSTTERPLLYITYARPFWVDVDNFDKARYENLPACKEFMSREERLLKRQRG